MKKRYEAPTVEKIAFNYRDQVVAASGANDGSGYSGGDGGVVPGGGSWQENISGLIGRVFDALGFCGLFG